MRRAMNHIIMEYTEAKAAVEFMLVARRDHSLSPVGRQFVLASFFLVSTAISLAFFAVGAWPVLPFAGLELAAVCWAFRCVARHAADFESIVIDGDRVVIERQAQGQTNRFEFNRYWAQVRCIPARSGQPASLVVRSHGREVVFGRHLP
ncbi:MAG: DUF2244 domain-containing protein, partial [Betaproteobacteria bacterium]|nr:DUF2244 domain-containing protein [Betaproteobacteria bacterium]